uniref:Uncharacterized protein n=1 Tax=Avena sativa TaxID=4498 RepID=A0ACD5XC14_AVESA
MAGYEKQQQQTLHPGMSAPYYAHPVPPPHQAYYAPPPPAPRRSAPGCFICSIFKLIAIVVIVLGAATLVLWLILRPGAVRATAVSATLARFDLADGHLLQYNLTVDVRVRNPNSFRIRYEYAEAQATYDGERFGYNPVDPFYLEKKSERVVTAAFAGSSPLDDGGARRKYSRERSGGFYFVKVRLYSDLAFKVRVFNARRKSKISCTLKLPVPGSSATPVATQLGTRCAVDF